jgi:hypothetical protein
MKAVDVLDARDAIERMFVRHLDAQGPVALETLKLTRERVREDLASELESVYVEAESRLSRERAARAGVTVNDARTMFALVQRGGVRR